MPKRKLNELYLEDVPRPKKNYKKYPHFELLAARYKGYLARREVNKMIFLFYWL
jgi:hypothetical protein